VEGFKPSKFGLQEHASTAYPLQGKHAALQCAQCHVPRGKETLYKINFERCLDCHKDEHQAQFAAAPYLNRCEQCHTLEGYKPSRFSLARHKQSRFVLTGAHLAVICQDCHKPPSVSSQVKPAVLYHFPETSCTTCHEDPHRGQFRERMLRVVNGHPAGWLENLRVV
jgi:tRNA G37 N-methylase Trm5